MFICDLWWRALTYADNAAFTVLETFVYLELSRMADLDADTALKAFETDHWPKHIESPGDISYGMLALRGMIPLLTLFLQNSMARCHGLSKQCYTST